MIQSNGYQNRFRKSNLHYARIITLKRVTSGRAILRSLSPRQHSFKEALQRSRAFGDTVSDLTRPVVELETSRTDSGVLSN